MYDTLWSFYYGEEIIEKLGCKSKLSSMDTQGRRLDVVDLSEGVHENQSMSLKINIVKSS